MTLSIKGSFATLSIPTDSVLSHYAQCRYAKYRYAECHYAECRYAECHYAEGRGVPTTEV